jgi:hypothetical protein
MSLPKTQWRYLGVVPCVSANTATIIEGIYNLGLGTTYPDGSARTPGSGSAGTYNLVSSGTTRVLHIDPAVRTINNKIVLCADTGGTAALPNGASRLPTLATGEAPFPNNKAGSFWGNSMNSGDLPVDGGGRFAIFSTIIKNPGNYSHWTAVNPFTSGSFYGYYRSLVTTSAGFTGNVYVYESTDCLAVAFVGSQNYFLLAGAIIDPESPDTTLDSESDGKLYGMITNVFTPSIGSNNLTWPVTNWLSTVKEGTNISFGNHSFNNGVVGSSTDGLKTVRSLIYRPGTSTGVRISPLLWYPDQLLIDLGGMATWSAALASGRLSVASLFTPSGRLVKVPLTFRYYSTANVAGRLRDIYFFSNSRLPRRLMNGNVPLGYAFGPSDSSDVNCLFLEH